VKSLKEKIENRQAFINDKILELVYKRLLLSRQMEKIDADVKSLEGSKAAVDAVAGDIHQIELVEQEVKEMPEKDKLSKGDKL